MAGFFDDRSAERVGATESGGLLGNLAELPTYTRDHGVDVIFIALPMRNVQRVVQLRCSHCLLDAERFIGCLPRIAS